MSSFPFSELTNTKQLQWEMESKLTEKMKCQPPSNTLEQLNMLCVILFSVKHCTAKSFSQELRGKVPFSNTSSPLIPLSLSLSFRWANYQCHLCILRPCLLLDKATQRVESKWMECPAFLLRRIEIQGQTEQTDHQTERLCCRGGGAAGGLPLPPWGLKGVREGSFGGSPLLLAPICNPPDLST